MGTMASKYGRGSGDISSFYGAAQRISCRNRPFHDLPMWVNGKTADLADKNKSMFWAPGRSQVAYQVAGANSEPLKNGRYSLVGRGVS